MDKTSTASPAFSSPFRRPDSGLDSLVFLARMHGLALDAGELCHRFVAGGGAASPAELVRAARASGLRARCCKATARELDTLPLPLLAETRDGGWLLLARVSAGRVLLRDADGAQPRIAAREDFLSRWSGRVLLVARRAGDVGDDRFGLRWFLRAARPHRRVFLEVLLASAAIQLLGLVTPLFFQVVVDKVLVHRVLGTLQVLVLGLVVIALAEAALGGLRAWLLAHTTTRIDVQLGARLYAHLLRLPLAWFEARRVGDVVARVRELETLRAFVTGTLLGLVIDLGFTLLAFVAMAFYSTALTLLVAATLPLFLALSLLVSPRLRALAERRFRLGADNQSFLVESVSGIATLKAMALEPPMQRRWEEQLAGWLQATLRLAQTGNWAAQAAQLINRLLAAAILWFGARAVIAGDLTVGELIAFNLFAMRVGTPVLRLFQVWQECQQARIGLERLGDVLGAPIEGAGLPPRGGIGELHGAIRFERVWYRYQPDRAPALAGVDIAVRAGEIIGIVGRSGSGKSTLARLLQRLHVAEQGRILVDGHDIALLAPDALRRQIAVVPQDCFLFNQSVRENIALGDPGMPLERVVRAATLAGAHDFICELPFGYDTPLGEHAHILSGGQRQRIAIARALVRDPRILILDEATSALDYESEQAVRDNLAAICAGRTVIIIAHRLTALMACERIIVLDRGRVAEQGTPAELLARDGLYARLHALQSAPMPAGGVS